MKKPRKNRSKNHPRKQRSQDRKQRSLTGSISPIRQIIRETLIQKIAEKEALGGYVGNGGDSPPLVLL